MISDADLAAARARAATTLEDTVTFRRTTGGTWTPEDGMDGDTETIWTGPCSISPAASERGSTAGGATASIDEWTIRVLGDVEGDHGGITAGDVGTVTSTRPGVPTTLTVTRPDGRTNAVLRRIVAVATTDTQAVPR